MQSKQACFNLVVLSWDEIHLIGHVQFVDGQGLLLVRVEKVLGFSGQHLLTHELFDEGADEPVVFVVCDAAPLVDHSSVVLQHLELNVGVVVHHHVMQLVHCHC